MMKRDCKEIIAETLARAFHYGQADPVQHRPYIEHCERVVSRLTTPDTRCVGWLHDVLEDCPGVTPKHLRAAGVPPHIVDAVVILTRAPGVPYADYITWVQATRNDLALAVKIADLLDHLTPECPERLRPRYEQALRQLSGGVTA